MKNGNFTVGMVHELCPICSSKMNEQIIIPKELTAKARKEIENFHNKAIGISDNTCESCNEFINNGYKALIGVDPDKSDNTFIGKYRTGELIWIKKYIIPEIFSDIDSYEDYPFMFVDSSVIKELINRHISNM